VFLGCDKEQGYTLAFSHYTHVTDNEMDCADCHGELKDGPFKKPDHAVCAECHDDWIETKEITADTCGNCHQGVPLDALQREREKEKKETKKGVETEPAGNFVHTESLAKRCAECHGNLMDEKLKQVPAWTRKESLRIREQSHRGAQDCATCHVDMDRETPPPNHNQNWTRRHGPLGLQPDNACGVCHTEQSCRECHQETMPESHNNLWRLKTHSIEAAWDRARCMVCHEQDSCTACHSEIRPQSHNASWEKTHCYQCHPSSATGTGCAFCHEGGLDAHPNPHPANWQNDHCRSCHPGTPEGDRCAVCHGNVGLGEHPNPHPANWESRHCGQCHNGQINGVSCAACHGGHLLDNHPNPHAANWETRHCTQCHKGEIQGVSCEECHGRNLAENHPNPHSASFVNTHCNNCHEGSTVYGVECGVCHGSDLLENHPNPHPAGFENSHCNSCHPGSQAANECEICHEGGSSVLVHEDFWPPVHDRFGDQANCYDCHY
jgi:hypothetical protein